MSDFAPKPEDHPIDAPRLERLFQLADRLRELKPWTFLVPEQVFGIRMKPDGIVHWTQAFQAEDLGYNINFMRGDKGLDGFYALTDGLDLMDRGHEINPSSLSIRQCSLNVEFVARQFLSDWDLLALATVHRPLPQDDKELYPRLVSQMPGFLGWRLEPEEADQLIALMEASLQILPQLAQDPDRCPEFPSARLPVWTQTDGKLTVAKERVPRLRDVIEEPKPMPSFAPASVGKYLEYPLQADAEWEIALDLSPKPVESLEQRPFLPYVIIICEARSGHAIASGVAHESLVGTKIMEMIANGLDEYNYRPGTLIISDGYYAPELADATASLEINVLEGDCPASEEALDAFFDNLSREEG